ncbi:secreted protein [Melampsora americana]|nr:secreted protein [Melampsora americana]
MKSDQLIASFLLVLVSQSMASLTNWSPASAQSIGNAMDLSPAGGQNLVKYPEIHNQLIESERTGQRLKEQGPPPYLHKILTSNENKEERVMLGDLEKSTHSSNLEIASSKEKFNEKVQHVGSSLPLPGRRLRVSARRAGGGGGHSGSENISSFSYMLSLLGFAVNWPLIRHLFSH